MRRTEFLDYIAGSLFMQEAQKRELLGAAFEAKQQVLAENCYLAADVLWRAREAHLKEDGPVPDNVPASGPPKPPWDLPGQG